jgi:hypothetical protein
MNEELHPDIAKLMKKYARDLGQISPSDSLDARIDQLVASAPEIPRARPAAVRRWHRPLAWAAAACLSVIAISAGIVIGMRLERSRDIASVRDLARDAAQQVAWAPEDLSMWPTDSVALTIPAEYSAQGTLVAVNPKAKSSGKRYWIDVVVSNDGTVKIERIVPAEASLENNPHHQAERNDVPVQIQ